MEKIPPKELGADFCVAIIRFRSGAIARLTIGTVARRNRSVTITGDKGILYIPEIWDDEVPFHFTLPRGATEMPTSSLLATSHGAKVNGSGAVNGTSKTNGTSASASTQEKGIHINTLMESPRKYPKAPPMDVCLGLADLASCLREKRRPRMAADYAFRV